MINKNNILPIKYNFNTNEVAEFNNQSSPLGLGARMANVTAVRFPVGLPSAEFMDLLFATKFDAEFFCEFKNVTLNVQKEVFNQFCEILKENFLRYPFPSNPQAGDFGFMVHSSFYPVRISVLMEIDELNMTESTLLRIAESDAEYFDMVIELFTKIGATVPNLKHKELQNLFKTLMSNLLKGKDNDGNPYNNFIDMWSSPKIVGLFFNLV